MENAAEVQDQTDPARSFYEEAQNVKQPNPEPGMIYDRSGTPTDSLRDFYQTDIGDEQVRFNHESSLIYNNSPAVEDSMPVKDLPRHMVYRTNTAGTAGELAHVLGHYAGELEGVIDENGCNVLRAFSEQLKTAVDDTAVRSIKQRVVNWIQSTWKVGPAAQPTVKATEAADPSLEGMTLAEDSHTLQIPLEPSWMDEEPTAADVTVKDLPGFLTTTLTDAKDEGSLHETIGFYVDAMKNGKAANAAVLGHLDALKQEALDARGDAAKTEVVFNKACEIARGLKIYKRR